MTSRSQDRPTWFESWSFGPFRRTDYAWKVVAALAAAVSLAAGILDESRVLLYRVVPMCVGGCFVPLVMTRVFELLTDWEDNVRSFVVSPGSQVDELFNRHFAEFRRWPGPLYAGSALALVGLLPFAAAGTFRDMRPELSAVGWAGSAWGLFMAGAGLASVYALVRVVRAVGTFPVRVSNHRFGVLSTGHLLRSCFVMIAAIWFCYGVSVTWQFQAAAILIGAFSVPTGLFLVGAFVYSQQPIHQQMLVYKRDQILRVEARLHQLMAEAEQFDERCRDEIEFLRKTLAELQALPEWPSRWSSMAGVAASAAAAVSPTLVGHFAPKVVGLVVGSPSP